MAVARSANRTPQMVMDELQTQMQKLASQMQPKSKQQQARDEVLAQLDKLAGEQLADEAVVFNGTKFVLPEVLEGDLTTAVKYLDQIREAEETEFGFSREYPFRPWDGAAAFQRGMLRVFGTSGIGKKTFSFFGTEPPEYRSIPVGVKETIQVPWGRISFAPLDATFTLGALRGADGLLFRISVTDRGLPAGGRG